MLKIKEGTACRGCSREGKKALHARSAAEKKLSMKGFVMSGKYDVKTMDINELFPDPDEEHFKRQGINKMCNLIRTALNDEHIHHIQFNCQDKKILLEAQKHPEKYPTLMVRVAGYSVYFTDLSTSVQNDIINRTEHHI